MIRHEREEQDALRPSAEFIGRAPNWEEALHYVESLRLRLSEMRWKDHDHSYDCLLVHGRALDAIEGTIKHHQEFFRSMTGVNWP